VRCGKRDRLQELKPDLAASESRCNEVHSRGPASEALWLRAGRGAIIARVRPYGSPPVALCGVTHPQYLADSAYRCCPRDGVVCIDEERQELSRLEARL
jgi:hypothetical protein